MCFLSTALAVPIATASIREQASVHPLLMFDVCAGNGGRSAGKNKNTEMLNITRVSDSELVFLSAADKRLILYLSHPASPSKINSAPSAVSWRRETEEESFP